MLQFFMQLHDPSNFSLVNFSVDGLCILWTVLRTFLPLGPPAQFVGELVQLFLCPPQLCLQVLTRGVELVLQQLQLVCRVGQPFP